MQDEVCPLSDLLVRGIAANGAVLACAAIATGTTEEARVRHATSPTATAALGRTLVAAAMLASGLKGRQSVMIRVLGDGPLGPMIAESTADGLLRGYVTNPRADLPPTPARKLDVGGAVGRGIFYVTRDVGLRDPYHSSVPLVTGEIGDDLAEYLKSSEQIPSVVAVGVLVGARDGVLASGGSLQVMPGAFRRSQPTSKSGRRCCRRSPRWLPVAPHPTRCSGWRWAISRLRFANAARSVSRAGAAHRRSPV
jgi:molecular chaperone Hsp33